MVQKMSVIATDISRAKVWYISRAKVWYHFTKGHDTDIPTVQLFTGTSRYTQSKSYMLSLIECVWEFRNNALWEYPFLPCYMQCIGFI